ncbi:MAG: hypothetical protein OEY09_10420 [Gammaproteobacteria bacterium]|nr:hypothetical protein [Gammaproteobacteria bacterium]
MAEKETSWWDSFNEGVKNVGNTYGIYKEVKADVDKRLNKSNPTSPPAKSYPSPSQPGITSFGEGQFGGFTGLQLGLVGALVIGLLIMVKVMKK